jgi:hypothetical protein
MRQINLNQPASPCHVMPLPTPCDTDCFHHGPEYQANPVLVGDISSDFMFEA